MYLGSENNNKKGIEERKQKTVSPVLTVSDGKQEKEIIYLWKIYCFLVIQIV